MNEKFLTDLEEVRKKVAKVKDDLGDFLDNNERAVMVAQTITATGVNLKEHGEPFSIRGIGCLKGRQQSGIDNNAAYKYLLQERYFVEQKRKVDGVECAVIFPTEKLIRKLQEHFK